MHHCPQCQTALPADAPVGLCPRCMLSAGLGERTEPQAAAPEPPPLTPEALGANLGQYDILERIGRGGMGAVFRARHRKLERPVAIKVLRPALSGDPAFAERFAREARALARLSHPGIVQIHDFGEAGPLFYLAMEYVDGCDLRRWMGSRPTPAAVLELAMQLCEALAYAHQRGVVHRDIKPENLLVDDGGRLRVADFGLAKVVAADEWSRLTGPRQILGTPHYMSPEQLTRPDEVDARADVFAVGVVLYELLTGELPIGRFEPPSASVAVPRALDRIIARCLEQHADRRYDDAAALREALAPIRRRLADAPEPGSRASAAARSPKRDVTHERRLAGRICVAGVVAAWASQLDFGQVVPAGLDATTLMGLQFAGLLHSSASMVALVTAAIAALHIANLGTASGSTYRNWGALGIGVVLCELMVTMLFADVPNVIALLGLIARFVIVGGAFVDILLLAGRLERSHHRVGSERREQRNPSFVAKLRRVRNVRKKRAARGKRPARREKPAARSTEEPSVDPLVGKAGPELTPSAARLDAEARALVAMLPEEDRADTETMVDVSAQPAERRADTMPMGTAPADAEAGALAEEDPAETEPTPQPRGARE